jgi:hypothetical protein
MIDSSNVRVPAQERFTLRRESEPEQNSEQAEGAAGA